MNTDQMIEEVLVADKIATDATLSGDEAKFAASISDTALVNAPNNSVVEGRNTVVAFRAGMISYSSFDRHIERTARLGDLVVTMGEETIVPKDKAPFAGKTVKRRFTDVWRKNHGRWQIEIRQATIISVD